MSTSTSTSHVSSASYPISQPLATILRTVVAAKSKDANANANVDANIDNSSSAEITIETETLETAFQALVSNSLSAIDTTYFSTPSNLRSHSSFQHRTAIRISTDAERGTLTITDLGTGMTRSDVINCLGCGGVLSDDAVKIARVLSSGAGAGSGGASNGNGNGNGHNTRDDNNGDEDSVSSDDSSSVSSATSTVSDSEIDSDDHAAKDIAGIDITDEDAGDDDDDEHQKHDEPMNLGNDHYHDHDRNGGGKKKRTIKVPAQAKDIGSFYAAMCALAEEVEIGTKSKFDDYYIFNLPSNAIAANDYRPEETQNEDRNGNDKFSHFTIQRPMSEGTKPTALNGFQAFTDIRGESGTRITLTLNQTAIDQGYLKQERVLKPLLGKFLQTSPYSVVLEGCCNDEEFQNIVDASLKEEEDMETLRLELELKENDDDDLEQDVDTNTQTLQEPESYNTVKDRAKFIPIRLSMGERKMLRLIEAAMACCDYTTDVDKPFKSSTRRTHAQMKHITSVLRGMVTACDYSAGQTLLEEDNYSDYEKFFRQMFEIARRHKIMNPEKMRTEYGKLIYLLQDAVSPSIQPHLSFSCKGQIETVYKFLEERDGLALLDDPMIEIATREVLADKKTRGQITLEIRRKERAVANLKQNYLNRNLSADDIHLCLYSICDNDSFLNSNRVPIDKIIGYLHHFFSPDEYEEGYSLSIVDGQDGSRLSHSHERQFYFALQSLTLWRDIIDDMFRLWAMAEQDLLSESMSYALQDTGQGHQRVQQSPQTYKSMQMILCRVQRKVNQWVGSNVIHLGDHNVPNALMFIDKYTQVPRILSPIVNCLENLERICEEDDGILKFVENEFGGIAQLKKDILYDFFKSAFDGSGADNFYDAGSCIDGRLTSAWNWCSQLQDKPFYCIFNLIGFTGFDGEFK